MARREDMKRRLENWRRWRFGSGSGRLGYAGVDLQSGPSSGYAQASVPTLDCEAEETDRAIEALERDLRATVHTVYLRSRTVADAARRLCIHERTLRDRMERVDSALSSWLADQAQRRRAEHERVQAATSAARP